MPMSYGARKIVVVEKLGCTEMANYIRLRAQLCQKYSSPEENIKMKVVWNWISFKKVLEPICLSPIGVELGGLKEFNSEKLLFRAFFHVMRIFGNVESLKECNLPFSYRTILQTCQSIELSSPTPRGWGTFLNLKRHLVVLKRSWFQQNMATSHTTTSIIHCGGGGGREDRHMRLRNFLDEIRFQTTFILIFFPCDAYLWQRWAIKWT